MVALFLLILWKYEMYLPAEFAETDPELIRDVIAQFPLATVVAQTAEGLTANHIPLIMTAPDRIIGHIAIANRLHEWVSPTQDIIAIFQGAQAYISPNWYPSKAESHSQVPTWNYEVVHVHGRMTFQHDEKSKIAAVGRLTKIFETQTNGADAWRMSDAPADFMKSKLAGIVAFEIAVTRIVAKSKLNQNKSRQDIENVSENLLSQGAVRMSERMKRGKSTG